MTKLNNTFAIGCLVQWYEIELVGEYVESLRKSIKSSLNFKDVVQVFSFLSGMLFNISFLSIMNLILHKNVYMFSP